ncbi:hypothetical protein PHYPSEUDO_013740 [Phytophthora pseudosyringae]|uniref:Uncharacterized protein n=1 Tax=Phytophthora pseudosyringae TaxID=221518 RepID=A0A8T1W2V6_9STRA|nr:hypothetical protein PHYPSEUDO_013740 [Phytophthora pseudosyringae]
MRRLPYGTEFVLFPDNVYGYLVSGLLLLSNITVIRVIAKFSVSSAVLVFAHITGHGGEAPTWLQRLGYRDVTGWFEGRAPFAADDHAGRTTSTATRAESRASGSSI